MVCLLHQEGTEGIDIDPTTSLRMRGTKGEGEEEEEEERRNTDGESPRQMGGAEGPHSRSSLRCIEGGEGGAGKKKIVIFFSLGHRWRMERGVY